MLIKLILKYIKSNLLIVILSSLTLSITFISIMISNFVYKNLEQNLLISSFGTGANKFTIQKEKESFIKNLFVKPETLENIYKDLSNNPKIKKIYGIYSVSIPTNATIGYGPLKFNTDIFLFASDEGNLCFSGKDISLGINPNLINIYNSQIANNGYLPKFNPKNLEKLNIQLNLGKNSFSQGNIIKNQSAKIILLDQDLPLFGFTIGLKVAEELVNNLKLGKIKLIKIIGYTKNPNYVKVISKKYKTFKVNTLENSYKQVYQKLKIINKIFYLINMLVLFFSISFVVLLVILSYKNTFKTIKTLIYNRFSIFYINKFFLTLISSYFLIAGIISYIFWTILNSNIKYLNHIIEQNGYIVNLSKINLDIKYFIFLLLFAYILGIFLILSDKNLKR